MSDCIGGLQAEREYETAKAKCDEKTSQIALHEVPLGIPEASLQKHLILIGDETPSEEVG